MNIKDIFSFRKAPGLPGRKSSPLDIFSNGIFIGNTSGNDATSLACINTIADSIGSLNGAFFNSANKKKITGSRLADLLKYPNADEAGFLFWRQCVVDLFTKGNCFIFKSFNGGKEPAALFRLNPDSIKVTRDSRNRKVFHFEDMDYYSDIVAHIPSRYGYDGLAGQSIFRYAKDIFTQNSILDEYVNNFFQASLGKRLVIDVSKENNFSNDEIERLRESFQQTNAGIRNAGRPLFKRGKIDFQILDTGSVDARSSQLAENRDFQERELSKLFGVPLDILKGGENGDIEKTFTLFLTNAVLPIATSIQDCINSNMIPLEERGRIYFEYDYNNIQKTSLAARIDSYSKQLTTGVLSVNEVRRKENLPENEAGDTLFVPSNLMPLKQDIIDSYMANSKIAQKNMESPDTAGNHSNMGDDKK